MCITRAWATKATIRRRRGCKCVSSLSSMKSLNRAAKEATERNIYNAREQSLDLTRNPRAKRWRDGDTNNLRQAHWLSSNNPHAFRNAQVGHPDAKRW